MRGFLIAILAAATTLAVIGAPAQPLLAKDIGPDVPRLTKEQLKSRLGDPDVIIVDVLVEEQWETTDQKIPGAVHENPEEVESWATKYPKDKTLVLY
jgi:hypothetical protein